ncbi:endonuclease III [Candidatus Bathyarchaeota archaeon]|nr:endonuclease III [Candidatus Bathyarchaeota archaeon]
MGEKTDASFWNRAVQVYEILKKEYPNVKVALNFTNPLEILVATILSAQCTDAKVNEVTKPLFKKYRTPRDYANADLQKLEKEIRPTGFYHNKAKHIQEACRMIVEDFGGKIPNNMEDLLKIPGVGRKTANIVLSNAYGIVDGIAVDTHVRRVSHRLGLTGNWDPNKIEKDLMKILPKTAWYLTNYLLIQLGRGICISGIPYCEKCPLNKICPSAFTFGRRKTKS